MNQAPKILDIMIKIQEHSDVFDHKQDGLLHEISLAEVHCIDCIGTIDHPNVTKISEKMGLTRAGISKVSKKLLAKDLIESYQDPENKKEIYFRLTESGQCIYDKHKKIHGEVRRECLSLLENYSDSEKAAILRFLTDISGFLKMKPADRSREEK